MGTKIVYRVNDIIGVNGFSDVVKVAFFSHFKHGNHKGYIACCQALSALDQRALLPRIKSPTLVIAGRHDLSTPVAAGEYIRSQIPSASMTLLDAAHISNI